MDNQNTQIDSIKNIEGAIEAILYAAGYPVKYTRIAEVLGIDVHNTKTLIEHMAKDYNSDKSKHQVLTEEQLKLKYPMDYGELTTKCKERYSDFVLNGNYHTNRRLYEGDDKCAYTRFLDPDKKKSGKKIFYSEVMLLRLDNHYTRKT